MHRRAHQILLFSLLTLYTVIALGGPGLHALPGFGHRPTTLATDDPKAPGQPDRHDSATHNCPICHFHSKGQLIADPVDGRCVEVVRIHPPADPPGCFPPAFARPSSPRAPPLA
ncbi:MAG: hypothetical protein AB7I30_01210 [Isosphaeraceae bacterium]